jgi:hypothetical protein
MGQYLCSWGTSFDRLGFSGLFPNTFCPTAFENPIFHGGPVGMFKLRKLFPIKFFSDEGFEATLVFLLLVVSYE